MSMRIPAVLAVLAASLAAGCATTAPPAPAAMDGPDECRDIVLPGQDTPSSVCGAPAQWAEYERRTAVYQPGVTCRELLGYRSNTVSTVCATGEEWAEYDRAEAYSALREVRRYQGGNYDR